MHNRRLAFVSTLGVCVLLAAADWPRFRGPNGEGIALDKTIPIKWTEKDYVWKKDVPGSGNSSPVIVQGRLFMQTATPNSRKLLCYDSQTGKLLWEATEKGEQVRHHLKNTLASSTPAADGKRVVTIYWEGEGLVMVAYDHAGKQLWRVPLGDYKTEHGAGLSPVLVGERVFVNFDQDGKAKVLAFNATDGALIWSADRKAFRACYSSPFILERDGKSELIVAGSLGITSYNPESGSINWDWQMDWTGEKQPLRMVGSPIAGKGLIFASTGDGSGSSRMVAIRPGSKGTVPAVWEKKTKGFPYVTCMLLSGDYLYTVGDKGIAGCFDAVKGTEIWRERLGGAFTSSPILVNGVIYAINEEGTCYTYRAAPKFELLGKMNVGERVMATPAVADGRLYIRTETKLLCLGQR